MVTTEKKSNENHGMHALLDFIIQNSATKKPWLYDALLYCSIPHWFDEDVIHGMRTVSQAPKISDRMILDELRDMPFCQQHPIRGWTYHEDVRAYILDRPEVQSQWRELNVRAATTFRHMLEQTKISGDDRFQKTVWKDLAVEWLYHWLNVEEQAALEQVHRICAEALAAWQTEFCAEFLDRIEWRIQAEEIDQPIKLLRDGVKALLEYDNVKALHMLYKLVAIPGLTPKQESALRWRIGTTNLYSEGRLADAREQFEKTLTLTPEDASIHAELAAVHFRPGPIWGRFDLALQHANRAVEVAPKQAEGYIALGAIAAQQQEDDTAIAWYEKALQAAPTVDSFLGLADLYSARGDVTQALALIDQALELSPSGDYFALLRKGDAYLNARRFQAARQAYEQAIDKTPKRRDAYIRLGNWYLALNQSMQAEEQYNKAIEADPTMDDGYAALARLHQQREAWDQAIEVCQQGLRQRRDSKTLHIIQSNVYSAQGRIEEVKRTQEQLARIDAAEGYAADCAAGDAYLDRAWQQRRQPGQAQFIVKARAAFESAVARDPKRAWAYLSLGELAVLETKRETVEELQRLVNERTPWAQYDLLVRLGVAYRRNWQPKQSEDVLVAATKLAHRRQDAWNALGDLYDWLGDTDRVARVWTELIAINPTLAYAAHMAKGYAFERISDYSHARTEYDAARKWQPDMADADKGLAHLDEVEGNADAYTRLALIDEAEGDGKQAIANYQRAAAGAADFAPPAHTRIAAIHRLDGNDDDAEQAAREAIRRDASYADAYIELARIGVTVQRKAGLVEKARKDLERVLPEKLYDLDYELAEFYRIFEEYERAHEGYQQCIARDSTRAAAYIGRALAFISQREYAHAQASLAKALQIDPFNLEAYFAQSELLIQQEDVAGVEETWQQITTLEPTRQYDALLALGKVYRQHKDLESAEQQVRHATELADWRPDAYIELGSLLQEQPARAKDAKRAYEQAQAKWAGVGYLELGRHYAQLGRRKEALEAYRLSIEYDPKRAAQAYVEHGYLLEIQDKYDLARKKYQQAVDAASKQVDQADGYMALASLAWRQGNAEETDEHLLRAKEVAPQNPAVYRMLAQLREEQSRWSAAIQWHEQVATLESNAVAIGAAYERIGAIFSFQGNYDEAQAALQKAVENDRFNAGAYLNLGAIYELRDNFDQAIAMYEKAIEIIPKYGDAHFALCRTYSKKGDQKSLKDRTRQLLALELAPSEKYAAYLLVAATYEEAGDAQEAEKTYRQAIKLDATNIDAYQRLVDLLVSQEQWENAVTVCRQMAEQPNLQYDAYVGLGNLFSSSIGQQYGGMKKTPFFDRIAVDTFAENLFFYSTITLPNV